jgi:DNA repair exonuclease SbcCD ATPase subunit
MYCLIALHREQGGWQDAAAAAQREAQLLRGQAAATAASLALLGAELAALKGERGRLLEAAAAQRAQATALEQVGTCCPVHLRMLHSGCMSRPSDTARKTRCLYVLVSAMWVRWRQEHPTGCPSSCEVWVPASPGTSPPPTSSLLTHPVLALCSPCSHQALKAAHQQELTVAASREASLTAQLEAAQAAAAAAGERWAASEAQLRAAQEARLELEQRLSEVELDRKRLKGIVRQVRGRVRTGGREGGREGRGGVGTPVVALYPAYDRLPLWWCLLWPKPQHNEW